LERGSSRREHLVGALYDKGTKMLIVIPDIWFPALPAGTTCLLGLSFLIPGYRHSLPGRQMSIIVIPSGSDGIQEFWRNIGKIND